MKTILLLTTGGTIASKPGEQGLVPELDSGSILSHLSKAHTEYRFDHENLMDLDSSNIQPEQWRVIARRVFDAMPDYDGIIITHGTDTMAYTASAMSFMIQNADKSIVFTGSQLPIEDPLTDATTNLYTAVEAVGHGIKGVTVAFNRKIIAGTRAVKVSTMGFDAFESPNAEYLAQIFADGIRIYQPNAVMTDPTCRPVLQDNICNDVFILKLLPGTRPEVFDALIHLRYRGIILEAFGAGGLHYITRDLLSSLGRLVSAGVTVVVCSQCLYERCDLSIYEVGRKILSKGVIPGIDMTTEAAATKLMWVLGQTDDRDEIARYFDTNIAGEITL